MTFPLQTPHSGYHWNRSDAAGTLRARRFFEGWYYRVTLPKNGQTFGFMYSIDDPLGNQPHSGGAAQILGANDEYLCRTFPDVKTFWAKKNQLSLGHWGKNQATSSPQLLRAKTFFEQVEQGYQATATLNQGFIRDAGTRRYCRWCYSIYPVYGWGDTKRPQKATAGWLSYLPIFDPGWQVLMAHGRASGWIDWNGDWYELTDAPAYAEKNWGRSFPQKWFWINCNSFREHADLSLTAVGGIREVLGWRESVGLMGLHYQGKFYQFDGWNAQLSWCVQPWGRWEMTAIPSGTASQHTPSLTIKLLGTTTHTGNYVRVPTAEGLKFNCRDTMSGNLSLELRESSGKLLINATSSLAGLEIGGTPWDEPWQLV